MKEPGSPQRDTTHLILPEKSTRSDTCLLFQLETIGALCVFIGTSGFSCIRIPLASSNKLPFIMKIIKLFDSKSIKTTVAFKAESLYQR